MHLTQGKTRLVAPGRGPTIEHTGRVLPGCLVARAPRTLLVCRERAEEPSTVRTVERPEGVRGALSRRIISGMLTHLQLCCKCARHNA
jgi:hypothetical protein